MKIVHASISENNDTGWNGKAKAGDQTGREVCVREWYNGMWNFVLRHSDANAAAKATEIAVKLAASNLVGYDQSKRNNLYYTLKGYDWDVDRYIRSGVKTSCDCSSFIYACYACVMPQIRSTQNAPVTANMKERYLFYGFHAFFESKYLLGEVPLRVGDILVKSGSHTVMVCESNPQTYDADALTIIARDVIRGVYGDGDERKENIYNAVQTRVNELLK